MIRPSFQFYPADWQANSNLRRCTHEEKGIWLDVLCLLHDQSEYGVCRWPLAEIAQAVGCTEQKLQGLINKGVLKGVDAGALEAPLVYVPRSGRRNGTPIALLAGQEGPLWYSSRMVIDEYKRIQRGDAGGVPNALQESSPNHSPKPPFGEAPKPTPKDTPEPSPKDSPNPSPFSCAQASRAAPSSSSSSSSSKEKPPNPADAGPAAKPRLSAIALQTFLDECQAKGERPLRDYAPLWTYQQGAKLPLDMVTLAWAEFRRRFLPGGTQPDKRQKDWRGTFRKYVENNYFKLWAIDREGQYFLTSTGKQAEKFQETLEAA
ncbi:hypothetical protein SAMN05880566_102213 [Janthinobacterium sp. TND4EL3]|jgi:hypothetical protein|uniref:hypothetical protein n=1 Tax=Janthinobacterium sp. TND4EL3 TaxID=1907311 RepID=UPI000953DFD3|nr:hypothetical protein [Janthinobacterium sp. TND4EL3]SIQ21531.1 hypothetical protein SAMN05880566_102213 [Janthinobacterium sp. TND4EL3]